MLLSYNKQYQLERKLFQPCRRDISIVSSSALFAATTVGVSTMSSKRWTDQETAFLLNYADECRLAKEDYMQTVESALLKHTGRSATYRAIQSKIRNLLSRHSPQNSLELFLLAGTAHFHELPPPLLIEMQKHRPEHLGGLQLRGTSDNTSRMEPLVDRDGTFNADDATRDVGILTL